MVIHRYEKIFGGLSLCLGTDIWELFIVGVMIMLIDPSNLLGIVFINNVLHIYWLGGSKV